MLRRFLIAFYIFVIGGFGLGQSLSAETYLDDRATLPTGLLDWVGDLDSDDDRVRDGAFVQLLEVPHVLAWDLVYEHYDAESPVVANDPGAVAAALLGSHYLAQPQGVAVFTDLWDRSLAHQPKAQRRMMLKLNEAFGEKTSLLRPWVPPPHLRELLTRYVGEQEVKNLLKSGYPPPGGPVKPDDAVRENVQLLEQLEAELELCDGLCTRAWYDRLLDVGARVKSEDGLLALDRVAAKSLHKQLDHAAVVGWEVYMADPVEPQRVMRLMKPLADIDTRQSCEAYAAAQDLVVGAIAWCDQNKADDGTIPVRDEGAVRSVPAEHFMLAMARYMTSVRPAGFKRDSFESRVDYTQLSAPFDVYVGGVAAEGGDHKAREYVQTRFRELALQTIEAGQDAVGAEERGDHEASATAKQSLAGLFEKVNRFVALVEHAQLGAGQLDKDLIKTSLRVKGSQAEAFLQLASERWPARLAGRFGRELQPASNDPDTMAERILRGEADLITYLMQMEVQGRLHEPIAFEAYRSAVKRREKIMITRAVIKTIIYNGSDYDLKHLRSEWLTTRPDALQSIIAAILIHDLDELYHTLVNGLPHMSHAFRRTLVARAMLERADVQQAPVLMGMMESPEQPEFARALAYGALCRLVMPNEAGEDYAVVIAAQMPPEEQRSAFAQSLNHLMLILREQ